MAVFLKERSLTIKMIGDMLSLIHISILLNEITTIPDSFILVLDDYHVIDSPSVDQALTFLLEHMPPHMHVALATREDPNLPLARLRLSLIHI